MVVAAEGVETEVQRLRLVELGCDRAQGYLLAPPEARAHAPPQAREAAARVSETAAAQVSCAAAKRAMTTRSEPDGAARQGQGNGAEGRRQGEGSRQGRPGQARGAQAREEDQRPEGRARRAGLRPEDRAHRRRTPRPRSPGSSARSRPPRPSSPRPPRTRRARRARCTDATADRARYRADVHPGFVGSAGTPRPCRAPPPHSSAATPSTRSTKSICHAATPTITTTADVARRSTNRLRAGLRRVHGADQPERQVDRGERRGDLEDVRGRNVVERVDLHQLRHADRGAGDRELQHEVQSEPCPEPARRGSRRSARRRSSSSRSRT